MTVMSLHFPIGEVTLAQRLRAMLATCDTKADYSTWCGDYLAHANLLPFQDARVLTLDAVEFGLRFRSAAQ